MSELTDKLLKVAADIDSLIEKIAADTTEKEDKNEESIKLATEGNVKSSTGSFGSVSDFSTKSKNPLLDFILS